MIGSELATNALRNALGDRDDEIRRLRAALGEIGRSWDSSSRDGSGEVLARMAKAALEKRDEQT